ncbi:hypothetical protein TNCV_4549101 [Trichonephila clavipes]|nr:hypothetical protein TNCV_4549101 [Trichonephila clavipes]
MRETICDRNFPPYEGGGCRPPNACRSISEGFVSTPASVVPSNTGGLRIRPIGARLPGRLFFPRVFHIWILYRPRKCHSRLLPGTMEVKSARRDTVG